MDSLSCHEITSAKMERSENNFQTGDDNFKVEIKHELPDVCHIESQSSTIFEDSFKERKASCKKTVICTEDVFIREFGGTVKSEVTLGDYEFDGVIKSEPTYEQNETEQPNEAFDDADYVSRMEMSSCEEMASPQMEQNENNLQCGDNNVKVEIKHEQPDEPSIEWQSSTTLEDSYNEPKNSPKKTVLCTDHEFIQDFGCEVTSKITFGEYEYDGVIKSEFMDEHTELEQPSQTHDLVESATNSEKQGESEVNLTGKPDMRSTLQKQKKVKTRGKRYKCDVCGKVFAYQSSLQCHKRVHDGVKSFKCDECGKTFTQQSGLQKHKRVHDGLKPFKCDQCDKTFTHQSNLKTHKRIHDGQKPFKCDQCDKTFTHQSNLKTHKRIHDGQKPFKCDECGRAFSLKSTLQTHKRVHDGLRPFKCDQCGKTFTQQSSLQTHKRVHDGLKPFKCDECGKTFTRQSGLQTHKRVHDGLKPFKCDECGKAFAHQSSLQCHKRGPCPYK